MAGGGARRPRCPGFIPTRAPGRVQQVYPADVTGDRSHSAEHRLRARQASAGRMWPDGQAGTWGGTACVCKGPVMQLSQLQSDLAARRVAAARRKAAATEDARVVLDGAQRQHRAHLTVGESARLDKLIALRDEADAELERLDVGLAECAAVAVEETEYARRAQMSFPTPAASNRPDTGRASLTVTRNERTYRPDTDPHGRGFLLDVTRNFLHADPGSAQRLARHMDEERVERPGYLDRAAGDTSTTNWAGLTVPQYLTDLYAPQISALRPFADACCVHIDLPPAGMSLNFSKITTGSSVALQAAQFDTVSATSLDDTLGTATVQTAAGSQNVSRQAIERGTGIENATLQDLMRKYAVALDSTLITQATTGLAAVAQAITYDDASPTGPEWYPYIYQASSKLEQALQGVAYPSHLVCHSRRWNWYASQLSSTWPLVNSAGVPAQSGAFQLTTEYGPQVRAVLASGLKVVVDNNIPTNSGGGTEDWSYVVASTESMYLAEDPNAPIMIRAQEPNAASLGVLLVVYGYFAYFSRYANPASVIKGTGTAAPTGF